MDLEKLKEYIKFMDENNLSELEIEEEGNRIKLKRNYGSAAQPVTISHVPNEALKEQAQPKNENLIEIKSPMVGSFYRAPSPGSKPYAEIGQVIKPGDVVCIVEAMKLMNEIKSEVSGKIAKIPVENGDPVEFGQVLFAVEPV